MDGSDDYYFGDDDFTFDEKTIAALDQQEKRWQEEEQERKKKEQEQSQREAHLQRSRQVVAGQRRLNSQEGPLPPPKKQKTTHAAAPQRAVAHRGRTTAGQDYDDDTDLPDISILGDGSYKLPAAQRATANELAAQIHGPSASGNSGGPSSRSHPALVRAPAPPPAPASTSVVPSYSASNVLRNVVSANINDPPVAPGSSQSQGPPRSKLARQNTFAAIQQALADLNAPAAAVASSSEATPPFIYHPRSSRASPVLGPTGAYPATVPPPRAPVSSSSSVRVTHQPAIRGTRGASPPVAPPENRRQSANGPSRQRVVSPPSVLPQPPRPQHPPQQPQPPTPQQHPPPPSQGQSTRTLQIELNVLRAQVEGLLKLQQDNEKAIEEAQTARYAKEGEVSILRKGIEKAAKDHAAEVARIKAAREQAEAQQAQLRKDMKEELERVKTQYLFKQHELETSARGKTPWSVRIKRTEGPLTPVSTSTQRRQAAAIERTTSYQTPSRSSIGRDLPDSPSRRSHKRIIHIPESPPKRVSNLPGFINAFEESPLKSNARFALSQSPRSQSKQKGKEKAEPTYEYSASEREEMFFNPPNADEVALFLAGQPSSSPVDEDVLIPEMGEESSTEPSSSADPPEYATEDVEMKGDEDKIEETLETLEPLHEPDWPRELNRIIFTHKHHAAKELTLQLLMNCVSPASAPPEDVQSYNDHCRKLLERLGFIVTHVADPDEVIRTIGEVLYEIGRVLCSTRCILPLTSLLDMIKIIAIFIPSFVSLAMGPTGSPGSGDVPPDILVLLCDIVLNLLGPNQDGLDDVQHTLAIEALGLLEALTWNTPPELVMRLTVFIHKEGVLSRLIHRDQPTWLLQRTMRVFTLMASYPPLHKHFLLLPIAETPSSNSPRGEDADTPQAEVKQKSDHKYISISHIEQSIAFLLDSGRVGTEGQHMKASILHFITMLAIADGDALNILLMSPTLLPSIILFLTDISSPLWEEDEELTASPELVTWTVQTMTRVVALLYHLFAGADPELISLRRRLLVPKKSFDGLWHMFTVTLGRISFASPPYAISFDDQMKLEQICDLGRNVLELVVDDIELEAIWAAFHIDDGEPVGPTQVEMMEEEPEKVEDS